MKEKTYTIEEIKEFIKSIPMDESMNQEEFIVTLYCFCTDKNIQKANSTHDKDQIKLL